MPNFKRIDKILSSQGVASRKEIKNIMKASQVLVDGAVVKDPSFKVDTEVSEIIVCGENLIYREFIYLMMNKPQGVISATFDPKHRTVIDLIPEGFKCFEPFPVGRLDIDSEGLLLLTNDGQLAHNLLSPKKHVSKKYYVETTNKIDISLIEEFQNGVVLDDGYKTLPATLKILENEDSAFVIIQEGKFHQIKRMFAAFDNHVKYLKRIQMGELKLDDKLITGEFRELTLDEIQNLHMNVK